MRMVAALPDLFETVNQVVDVRVSDVAAREDPLHNRQLVLHVTELLVKRTERSLDLDVAAASHQYRCLVWEQTGAGLDGAGAGLDGTGAGLDGTGAGLNGTGAGLDGTGVG